VRTPCASPRHSDAAQAPTDRCCRLTRRAFTSGKKDKKDMTVEDCDWRISELTRAQEQLRASFDEALRVDRYNNETKLCAISTRLEEIEKGSHAAEVVLMKARVLDKPSMSTLGPLQSAYDAPVACVAPPIRPPPQGQPLSPVPHLSPPPQGAPLSPMLHLSPLPV